MCWENKNSIKVYKSIGSDVIELLSSLRDPIETASMYDSRTRFLLSPPPPPGLVAIRGNSPKLSTEDRVLFEPWFLRATTPFWRPDICPPLVLVFAAADVGREVIEDGVADAGLELTREEGLRAEGVVQTSVYILSTLSISKSVSLEIP